MTIVPLGSMRLQVPENGSLNFEQELVEQIRLVIPQIICRVLSESMETEVERMLNRKRYKRRSKGDRQRTWEDLEQEICVEYGRGLSYRQIKVDLDERLGGSVGLRTLNRRVLAWGINTNSSLCWEKDDLPPVVRVDGIWITVMFATGDMKTDRLGR
jgi:hypothetical protein